MDKMRQDQFLYYACRALAATICLHSHISKYRAEAPTQLPTLAKCHTCCSQLYVPSGAMSMQFELGDGSAAVVAGLLAAGVTKGVAAVPATGDTGGVAEGVTTGKAK